MIKDKQDQLIELLNAKPHRLFPDSKNHYSFKANRREYSLVFNNDDRFSSFIVDVKTGMAIHFNDFKNKTYTLQLLIDDKVSGTIEI